MRLRTLTTACLVLVILGGCGLGVLGLRAWQKTAAGIEDVSRLRAFHDRAEKMGAAVDYLTLLQPDAAVAKGLAADARDLVAAMRGARHPLLRPVRSHLVEIAHIAGEFAGMVESSPLPIEDHPDRATILAVARQLRIHHTGVLDALYTGVGARNRAIIASLRQTLTTFVLASSAFIALGVVSLVVIRRRVGAPIRSIETGIAALERGDASHRIPVDADDELGRLAAAFNQMAERRQRDEAALAQSERLSAIGALTGGIAHDFNNLLTVILGNAESLQAVLEREAERHLAEMIFVAAERGADLTRHLLAFARRQALEPSTVDLNRLIADMDRLLRRSLGEHIEVEFTRGGGLWPALVDPGQVESALLNLCLNARDAMVAGGRLTIETANAHLDRTYADENSEVRPGQYVMIAVSDTGAGIAPEHLARVFEPFFSTKEKGKGTGLGLSMVYGFVKQSGGHIKIYSEVGEGTTVRMYLPRSADSVPVARRATAVPAPVKSGERVLLVEDDLLVLAYAREQLSLLGYAVTAAASGSEAMECLRRGDEIDLLLTDVVMPGGMSGRELADEASALRPGLKVLFSSGYTENAIVHQGRLDPGVRLLAKPYRRAELARRVREALDG